MGDRMSDRIVILDIIFSVRDRVEGASAILKDLSLGLTGAARRGWVEDPAAIVDALARASSAVAAAKLDATLLPGAQGDLPF